VRLQPATRCRRSPWRSEHSRRASGLRDAADLRWGQCRT